MKKTKILLLLPILIVTTCLICIVLHKMTNHEVLICETENDVIDFLAKRGVNVDDVPQGNLIPRFIIIDGVEYEAKVSYCVEKFSPLGNNSLTVLTVYTNFQFPNVGTSGSYDWETAITVVERQCRNGTLVECDSGQYQINKCKLSILADSENTQLRNMCSNPNSESKYLSGKRSQVVFVFDKDNESLYSATVSALTYNSSLHPNQQTFVSAIWEFDLVSRIGNCVPVVIDCGEPYINNLQ